MKYEEAWNDIVEQYSRNRNKNEDVIQNSWNMLFKYCFGYSFDEIIEQQNVKMGTSTKYADIVIKENNVTQFVVELKKHDLSKDKNQAQLFSYLSQLKVNIGILVCDNIYIFDYDFTAQGDKHNVAAISFEKNNQDGTRFVELFSKENFDREKIRAFIKEVQKKNEEEMKGKNESKLQNNKGGNRNMEAIKSFNINDKSDYIGPMEIYTLITGKNSPQRCFIKLNKNYYLWVINQGGKNGWKDLLSADGEILEETDELGKEGIPSISEPFNRVIFVRGLNGNFRAKFVGIFKKVDVKSVNGKCVRYYKRIATEISLDELR